MSLMFRLAGRRWGPQLLQLDSARVLSQARTVTIKCAPAVAPRDESHDERNMRLVRPQSPHLTIYKPQLTSMLSISHRATGMVLTGYTVLFSMAAVYLDCPLEHYIEQLRCAEIGFGSIYALKFLIAFPLTYHFWNGIRHLIWDTGKFLTIREVYATGWAMLAVAFATAAVVSGMTGLEFISGPLDWGALGADATTWQVSTGTNGGSVMDSVLEKRATLTDKHKLVHGRLDDINRFVRISSSGRKIYGEFFKFLRTVRTAGRRTAGAVELVGSVFDQLPCNGNRRSPIRPIISLSTCFAIFSTTFGLPARSLSRVIPPFVSIHRLELEGVHGAQCGPVTKRLSATSHTMTGDPTDGTDRSSFSAATIQSPASKRAHSEWLIGFGPALLLLFFVWIIYWEIVPDYLDDGAGHLQAGLNSKATRKMPQKVRGDSLS
ncbi:hypothetical protein HUJ04_011992 [Dendroctonus ponderosae]|nr:hypothetical protein HUJ04_011992 [Dendroctonus ponderosae]